ncbi:DUF3667 domain-containing protein [Luteimonas sp. 8-5]|uniref:DUF3667 domain-containing protein n=1 Tax=Luteimonas sp. 8-5 TaxID=3039387 RepID=UPI0024368B8F|nr:DUF3667 domain-containing protein [Luteimonas sp. 8-5]MDG6349387.1 DUF3667 domain-containing protein [Luteimonas sp. 8-5]
MTTCQNCGTELLGPHCYKCGQPVHGLVRHFGSIIGDFLDSVFDLDSRTPRTIWPLLAKPGYLTCEYFEGRRVRYVSPVRLFFFLSIVTFFVAQLAIQTGDGGSIVQVDGGDGIEEATTVAEVEEARDRIVGELEQARAEMPPGVPGARAGINAGIQEIREKSEQRIAQLEGRDPEPVKPAGTDDDEVQVRFNAEPWDPVTNPVRVGWLPAFVNRWINAQIAKGRDNVKEMQHDQDRLKDAVLGALPSTLFILLPLFAAMLKVAYLFKRRLYMEHLIVALHSHAFLCLAVLLILLLSMLGEAVPALATPVGWAEGLLFLWMPLYLLLMQKRVYGQGWIMTLLKYLTIGICYIILLSFGVAGTILASLVWG